MKASKLSLIWALVSQTALTAQEIAVFNGLNVTNAASERFDNLGTHLFPDTPVGAYNLQWFTIKNVGSTELSGLALSKIGTHANDFVLSWPTGVTTLAPQAYMSFAVAVLPTATGARSAVVRIASNDQNENPFEINVSGTGLPPAPEISVVDANYREWTDNVGTKTFADTVTGTSSAPLTVRIRNLGTTSLTTLALSVSGANPSDFILSLLETNNLPSYGSSTTFTITFAPRSVGHRSAVVNIFSNDEDENPFQIHVTGTSVAFTISQPTNALTCIGDSTNFSAFAEGATGYQWQRRVPGSPTFVNISGATSSVYNTPATVAGDDGTVFRILVSKGATNQLSHEALLSVLVMKPPTVGYDFNSTNLNGATIHGDAFVANGVLELHRLERYRTGTFLTPDLAPGAAVGSFTAAFKVRMWLGVDNADGFSFNWASDLDEGLYGENGAGSGLRVCFDTYESNETGSERHAEVRVIWKYQTIATFVTDEDFFDQDEFVNVAIRLHNDGTLDVSYFCVPIFMRLPLPEFRPLTNSRFGLGARTGGLYTTHTIDDLAIGVSPGPILEATVPGDAAIGTSANSPAAQLAPKAIDNTVTNKYLNFDKLNTGLTITPFGRQPVRALTLISAEDSPARDPSSFVLEGSNDGTDFTRIASNAVPAFPARNFIQSFAVANTSVFNQYRLLFPTVANAAAANSMQIAEVELLHNQEITSPNDTLRLTLPPGATDVRGVGTLFDRQLAPLSKFEVWSLGNGNAVVDITPTAGRTLLKGFELIGAADDLDYPQRRPSSVTIAGSVDGINYTPLATVIPGAPTANLQIREFGTSSNTIPFWHYRITFGPPVSGTVLQVGEMRFFGNLAPLLPEIAVYTGNTAHAGAARISGGSYVFPDTAVSQARTATFTIQNVGETNLSGLVLGRTGPGVNDYSVSPLNTTSLAPNATGTFFVNFAPTAAGARGVSIWITSNDADDNPFEIKLSGTGRANTALAEVSIPGDPVMATSASSPAGQGPDKAIDNNVTTKYLNLDKLNSGLTITPLGNRPVRALTLISAEDAPPRDPSSFVLEGSVDGIDFTPITSDAVPAFPTRHFIQSFSFPNTNLFNHYRVRFPTVADAAVANSMQIAEVELLYHGEITSTNDTVSITLPADAVDVRGVSSLFDRQLDDIHKLEVAPIANRSTIVEIIPAVGPTVLKSFELIGASDDFSFPQRRPNSVAVAGSNDGVNYTDLATVTPVAPSSNLQIQEFATLSNNAAFARYRITFGPPVGGDRLQVGEMRLFGEIIGVIPTLTIRASGTNAVVSWPDVSGFNLETKTDPTGSGWTPVAHTPALSNGVITVTLPMSHTAAFFRLRK